MGDLESLRKIRHLRFILGGLNHERAKRIEEQTQYRHTCIFILPSSSTWVKMTALLLLLLSFSWPFVKAIPNQLLSKQLRRRTDLPACRRPLMAANSRHIITFISTRIPRKLLLLHAEFFGGSTGGSSRKQDWNYCLNIKWRWENHMLNWQSDSQINKEEL